MKSIIFSFLFLGCQFISIAQQERITSFDVNITVNEDRSFDVEEIIRVNVQGYNIKHGIFRDILTVAIDENGNKQFYDLDIKKVLLNGNEENHVITGIDDGKEIRIGSGDVYLENGEHEYTIAYNINNQVRFFDDHDELYWNATGNQWQFVIEKASATVTLPQNADIIDVNGFTGDYGSTDQNFTTENLGKGKVRFETTKSLLPFEGLTISVSWPKGIIEGPTPEELKAQKMRIYKGAIYGAIGVIIIFLYLYWAWKKVGVDPIGGPIIPRFEPPSGFSPAASRYVMRMGFDNISFSSSMVSMAVKGYLKIDNTGKKYKLVRISDDNSKLTNGERKIASKLFSGSGTSILIDNKNHSKISAAISELENSLEADFKQINFARNGKWMVPAVLLAIANCIIMLVNVAYDKDVMVPMLFGMILLWIVTGMTSYGIRQYRKTSGLQAIVKLVTTFAPFILFVLVPVNLFVQLDVISYQQAIVFIPYGLVFVAMISLVMLFFYLMKAPTINGRKVLDEIEGLKMFMEVAEKDRLNMLNPPDKTPQLFEKLLPYAIALGVENKWGKQFENIIAEAIKNNEYTPTWYVGNMHTFAHVGNLSSDLGSSFSSSISSASMAPQSSSSSGSSFGGGGGFSGGGGGGGGGGGW